MIHTVCKKPGVTHNMTHTVFRLGWLVTQKLVLGVSLNIFLIKHFYCFRCAREYLSFSNLYILSTCFWELLLHPGLYTQKGNKFSKIGSNSGIYIKLNLLMVKSGNLISLVASKVVSGQFILPNVCKNIWTSPNGKLFYREMLSDVIWWVEVVMTIKTSSFVAWLKVNKNIVS